MSKGEIVLTKTDLIKFKPTEIVEIALGDLTAPIATAIELQKLAISQKVVYLDLLTHSPRDDDTDRLIVDPNAIHWGREYRATLKTIHELTKGIQEKAIMKKIDIVGELYKQIAKNKKPHEIIELIRDLENE
jgi:hypothetical protein